MSFSSLRLLRGALLFRGAAAAAAPVAPVAAVAAAGAARVRALRACSAPVGACRRAATSSPAEGASYQTLLVSRAGTKDRVGVVTLNRPRALNALSSELFAELNSVLAQFDDDPSVGAVVLTGSERAFAAGADIKEMVSLGPTPYATAARRDLFADWGKVGSSVRKPIVAAVNGFAIGGGCELVLMCDIVLAGDTAQFGQPEITLGIIPGAGGTQRLVRAVGKSKAMEMILTGKPIRAKEAEACGLVARVFPAAELLGEAIKMADRVASFSQPAVRAAKECVNRAFESSLAEGLLFERRAFHSCFATADHKEGMTAFVEKRKPEWKHE